MKIWLAYIDDLMMAFDPDVHCDPAYSGTAGTMELNENAVATVTITRMQSGWDILRAGAKRNALLIESATGDPADARVFARGRIVGLPGDPFADLQTIKINCSIANLADVEDPKTETVDGPKIAFCRANLAGAPEFNRFYSDVDKDNADSYLKARAQVFFYDPVSLEVDVDDIVAGPVVNLNRADAHDDKKKPTVEWGDAPLGRARCTVQAPWQQVAIGLCNIAGAIQFGYVSENWGGVEVNNIPGYVFADNDKLVIKTASQDFTVQASTDAIPDSFLNSRLGAGWSLGDGGVVKVSEELLTPSFQDGRVWNAVYTAIHTAGGDVSTYDVPVTHIGYSSLVYWQIDPVFVWMKYDLQQERQETAIGVLDMPIQSIPSEEKYIDLGELSLRNITDDPDAIAWTPGDYKVGDKVVLGDKVYVCNEDHTSTNFFQSKDGKGFISWSNGGPINWGTGWTHDYWDEVTTAAAILPSASAFWTTDAGALAAQHMVMRMRKALLERSRALRVTLTYDWATARDVTLRNSVRAVLPWQDGTPHAIVGKVASIKKSWGGEDGPMIEITIAVSFGTGADGVTDANGTPSYGHTPNYLTPYAGGPDEDEQEVLGVCGDTEFVVDPDPVPRPVVAEWLPYWPYSVLSVLRENELDVQYAAATFAGLGGSDPRWAVQKNPTKLTVVMRNLPVEGTLQRNVYIVGDVLTSPRGIDLVNGDEP